MRYCFVLRVAVVVAQIFTRVVTLVGSLVGGGKFDPTSAVFSCWLIIVLIWVLILVTNPVVALVVALWVLEAALSPRCHLREFSVPPKPLLQALTTPRYLNGQTVSHQLPHSVVEFRVLHR